MAKRVGGSASLLLIVFVLPLLLAFSAGAQTIAATSSLLVKLVPDLSSEQQANVIARNGGVVLSSIPALRLYVIAAPPDSVAAVATSYQADPQVQHVEQNKPRVSEAVPSDPLYANQWYLPRIGWEQVFGSVAPSGAAKVALLDTGVDAAHPDLAGKVVSGISILDGSNGMTDPSGHGTWLAGIIAARTDAAPIEGVAAVAFGGVQIMPVTVLNPNGEGMDSDVIAGVIWAADHGADVIVMAFSNPGFSPSLQDAIDYAWSKGAVLIAAVGNNASSEPTFPAGDRGVMGVAATDAMDGLAYFSNNGQAVFIAAPGTDVQTLDIGDAYTVVSGTSTSAAIVAGAAALMKAIDPTLTNGVIVGRLARNADAAGTQADTGNGRLNLARSLADTSTEPLQPAGADPVGTGGPFVGPYQAAARSMRITFAGTGGGQVKIGASSGAVSFATSGGNRCDTAPASGTGNATLLVTINGTCTTLSSSDNGATVTVTAVQNGASFFAGWSSPSGSFTACTLTSTTCSVVLGGGQNDLTVTFSTRVSTTTVASNATATYGDSGVTLNATVTPASGSPVGEGTVTFNVKKGATLVGTVTSGTVSAGNASASFPLAGVNADTYALEAIYNPAASNPRFATSSDVAKTLTLSQVASTTTAASKTVTFSTTDQSVSLTATVTSGAGSVNQGSVIFTVKDGATAIGSPTSGAVTGGGASATYTVPGGSPAKTYTIEAAYSSGPTGNFADSSDDSKTLTVNKAGTTTAAASATATYSTTDQTVTLTATISSGAGPVNQGSMTFTVKDGATVVGGPASGSVASGNATATYTLPSGSPAKAYTIEAAYSSGGAGSFADSSDTTKSLTVNKAGTTTTAAHATATFSSAAQTVTLTATISAGAGPVNQGSVTFTVKDGATVVGSPTSGSVTGGNASVSFTLPGGAAAKTYQIAAAYTSGPTGNFADSADDSRTLTVNSAPVTVAIAGGPFTYDGQPHAASVTTSPSIAGYTLSYSGTATAYSSSAPPTNADTYTVTVSITDPNYVLSGAGTGSVTINKATPTVSVTGGTFTYDGSAHAASGFAYGVGGVADVLSPAVTFSYAGSGSTVYGPSAIAPTNAGTYEATASFPGNLNYSGAFGTAAITIHKADPSVTVTGNICTYDGSPCAGSGSATGSNGESLTPVNLGYATTAAPGNLLTSAPVNVGTYLVAARYPGDTNYNATQSAPAIITIHQATPTVSATGGAFTYDGNPHGASGFAYGVGGVADVLTPAVTFSYAGSGSTVYGPSAIVPTNAGFYEVTAFFAGNSNYTNTTATAAITISPATTSTTIVAPTITNNTTLTITVNVTSAGGVPGGSVELTLNSGPSFPALTLASRPLIGGSASFVVPGLSDGSYLLGAGYTTDGGNFLASNGAWTTVIDTAAPDTVIDSGPAGLTTATSATFTYHGSDSGGDTFKCSLDGGPWTDCNDPAATPGLYTVIYTGLLPGPHSFQVRGTDGAGNADGSPASRSWIIGSVTNDLDTVDEGFKHFDGFDVVFGKGTGTSLKITSTNPGTFHHQLLITNNTGVGLNTPDGQTAYTSAIIEVPGVPASCGPNVPCSSQIEPVRDPAFKIRGHSAAHVWPDNREEQLAITVQYMTLAEYQNNGNSCADVPGASYSSVMPADGAPKCIKVSGFALPHKHQARIRTNFEFRLRGTDLWDPSAKLYFFAGFPFRSATTVTYGGASQTSIDAAGIVGAGNRMTAVGGFVFNPYGEPGTSMTVRLFNSLAAANAASCASTSNVVAQDIVDLTGFYFIWRTGALNDAAGQANLLPSGVQYAVQLCNGATQVGPIKATENKLHNQEFEQVDFDGVMF
jgi:subtilisin family serine protease